MAGTVPAISLVLTTVAVLAGLSVVAHLFVLKIIKVTDTFRNKHLDVLHFLIPRCFTVAVQTVSAKRRRAHRSCDRQVEPTWLDCRDEITYRYRPDLVQTVAFRERYYVAKRRPSQRRAFDCHYTTTLRLTSLAAPMFHRQSLAWALVSFCFPWRFANSSAFGATSASEKY